ncbi:MAG: DUF4412 domain-containing protein [Chthoniobacterales bacterium]
MKIFAFALLGCASFVGSARADLTLVQRIEGAGPVSSMILKIKGDKARIEMGPQMTTIIDGKTGNLVTYMNEQKKFMRISPAQAKAAAELAMSPEEKNAPPVKPQLKPTGKKEMIDGYETQEYVCDAPAFKGTYWIATNYPDGAAILKQLVATTPEAWNVAGKGMPDYRAFPGVPLRTRVAFNGKEIKTTIVSIKQDPLPDSEFTAPAGFEEMKLPNMDALLGGKAPSSKPAASPK